MATTLSLSNGAKREGARAFVNGWQYADRVTLTPPNTYVAPDDEHMPKNGVLLAAFLRGMMLRWAMYTHELEEALELIGE